MPLTKGRRLNDRARTRQKRFAGTIDFSPGQIDALVHWYRADSLDGRDGSSVGTWPDLIGSADLTQGTADNQPTLQTDAIGGHNVVRGDGSNDALAATHPSISQPTHIFVVYQFATTGSTQTIYDGDTSRQLFREDHSGGQNELDIYAGTQLGTGSAEQDTDLHVAANVYNGANSILRQDGTQLASGDAGANALEDLVVLNNAGRGSPVDGDIAELLVFDTELRTATRDRVEHYLVTKHGILLA